MSCPVSELAAFFDVDKTMVDSRGNLYAGLGAALNPMARQFAMTSVTARGYPRYLEATMQHPQLRSTPGMPIALENGGRIVDSELTRNLEYHPLSGDALTAIADFIADAPPMRYVGFHSKTLRARTQMWSPDIGEVARINAEWSHNAKPFTGTIDDLFSRMREHAPCLVIARLATGVPENLPPGITAYSHGSTVNFVPESVNKGVAAQAIAGRLSLALSDVLYAGNDYNDLPALSLPGLGCPVAVGPDITPAMLETLPPNTVHLPDQNQLAGFLIERFS